LTGLHETAYGIELSGRDSDIDKAKILFMQLKEEFKKLKDALPLEKRLNIEQKIPNME
jgi:hypothetical protein